MPTERRTHGFVYRWGRRSAQNCTPRPGVDTTGHPGLREPGLSTSEHLEAGKGPAIRIDVSLLRPPLLALADDPSCAGPTGHVTITPVSESGQVDPVLLEEWAQSRAPGSVHPLTQIVLDAVVAEKVMGPQ